MSDPAKSADEIEDVLASIRRLVAESGSAPGPARGLPAAPPPAAAADDAEDSGKLLLTPALRVSDPDDPWAPVPRRPEAAAPAPAAEPEPEAEAEPEDPAWGLEDRLSDWGEIEASAAEAVSDAIAEGHSDDPGPPPVRLDLPDPAARLAAEAIPELSAVEFEPETGDADWPGDGADRALRELAMVRGQAPAAAAPDADDDTAHAARPEEDEMQMPPELPRDMPDMPEAEAPVEAAPAPEPEAVMEAEPEPEPEVTPIFARRAASIPGREATRPRVLRPDAEAPAPDPDAFDVEDLGEAEAPFSFPDAEEGILDEETLRELIAEVVREELQGALGQRITRNVRKMVRREIRLALAAEDFD